MKSDGSAAKILVRSLLNRARLATLEAGQAGEDLLAFALVISGAAALGMGAFVGLHLLLLALLWESEYKSPVLGLVVLLEGGGCVWLVFYLRSRLAGWSPFEATREQCEKDAAWAEELLNRPPQ